MKTMCTASRHIYLGAIFLLALTGCRNPFSLQHYESRDTMQAAIRNQMERDRLPGLAYVLGRKDSLLAQRFYGAARVEDKRPVGPDTDFEWYSVTKLFTTTAILMLQEEMKLDLDDPVSKYLEWFRPTYRGNDAYGVTIRHLLTHTAGLADKEWRSATWLRTSEEQEEAAESGSARFARQIFREYHALRSPPGEKYQYSNISFILLGEIVSVVSGTPLDTFVTQRVLLPLGLERSYYHRPSIQVAQQAKGYEPAFSMMGLTYRLVAFLKGAPVARKGGYLEIDPLFPPHFGYIGLRGSAPDLALFAASFTGEEELALLGDSSLAQLRSRQFRVGDTRWMGLGWQILRDFHGEFIRHLGGGPGFKTEIRVYEDGTYLVVTGNSSFDIWNYSNLLIYNLALFTSN